MQEEIRKEENINVVPSFVKTKELSMDIQKTLFENINSISGRRNRENAENNLKNLIEDAKNNDIDLNQYGGVLSNIIPKQSFTDKLSGGNSFLFSKTINNFNELITTMNEKEIDIDTQLSLLNRISRKGQYSSFDLETLNKIFENFGEDKNMDKKTMSIVKNIVENDSVHYSINNFSLNQFALFADLQIFGHQERKKEYLEAFNEYLNELEKSVPIDRDICIEKMSNALDLNNYFQILENLTNMKNIFGAEKLALGESILELNRFVSIMGHKKRDTILHENGFNVEAHISLVEQVILNSENSRNNRDFLGNMFSQLNSMIHSNRFNMNEHAEGLLKASETYGARGAYTFLKNLENDLANN